MIPRVRMLNARQFIAAVLLTRRGGRSFSTSIGWLFLLAVLAVVTFRSSYFGRHPFTPSLHTAISMNQALMRTHCGRSGPVSPRLDLYALVRDEPRLLPHPFTNTIVATLGSLEEYCSESSPNFLNNENSLTLLMEAALRLAPGLSPAGLGTWLRWCQLVPVFALLLVALRCGAPVVLSAAALAAVCSILSHLNPYSAYALLLPVLVLTSSAYVAAARWARLSHRLAFWGVCGGAGVLTGFSLNVRTSLLPTLLLMFGLFLVATRSRYVARSRMAIGVLLFVSGVLSFDAAFIRPLSKQQTLDYNYSYHPLVHPLVLSLALPAQSPLTEREGIKWDDSVGLALARRMIPDVTYLGPTYERALLLYYVKLWVLYPQEMRNIYAAKLRTAGTGAFSAQGGTSDLPVSRAVSLMGRPTNGVWLVLAFVALAAAGAWSAVRRRSDLCLLGAMLALAAVMMMLEAALVYPMFLLDYHSYLLFSIACAELTVGQLLLEVLLPLAGVGVAQ